MFGQTKTIARFREIYCTNKESKIDLNKRSPDLFAPDNVRKQSDAVMSFSNTIGKIRVTAIPLSLGKSTFLVIKTRF